MPERICCNTEFLPFRLLRSARLAAMRLTDPDRYGTIVAVREAARITAGLARGAGRQAIAEAESAVFTQLQNALKGRSRLSRRSLLPLAGEVFLCAKDAVSSLHGIRRSPHAAELLEGLMAGAAQALTCLEMELSAASAAGAAAYRANFRECELRLRGELRAARTRAPALDDHSAALAAATALTAFDRLLAGISRVSHEAARRRRGTGGH